MGFRLKEGLGLVFLGSKKLQSGAIIPCKADIFGLGGATLRHFCQGFRVSGSMGCLRIQAFGPEKPASGLASKPRSPTLMNPNPTGNPKL